MRILFFSETMKTISPAKSAIIFLLFLVLPPQMQAQVDTIRDPEQFLFPEFTIGVARTLNGGKVVLNLNYNIVTEKMVFLQNGQIFDIANPLLIDTVFIERRKFIPSGKVFYEIVADGTVDFFIQHKGSVKKPPRPAAYGGTSEVSSSTYITTVRMGNDIFRMQEKAPLQIEDGSLFLIRKDYQMSLVTGKKSLLKIFEDRKGEIREFMGKSKFDSEDPDQIYKLVIYYNGLL